jgi:hypothetical protein
VIPGARFRVRVRNSVWNRTRARVMDTFTFRSSGSVRISVRFRPRSRVIFKVRL